MRYHKLKLMQSYKGVVKMSEDIKIIFSNNLNRLMEKYKETAMDLSEKTGIPYSTVNDWKNAKKMARGGNLQKLSDHFGVNTSDLTSENILNDISNIYPLGEMVSIPIIGEIACGDPIIADENIIGYRLRSKEGLISGNTFYLKANGDSMEPKIPNGADVLIREQASVEDGEIAAVLVNGDTEATLKRVHYQNDSILLIAENSLYQPYIVNKDNPARILGKAIEVSFDL